MIVRLKLTNFKCFEKLDLELSNLNVLAGINSMGKSTVVQALLLLRQAYELGSISEGLHLNGDIANIGVGYDILYRASEKDEFSIEIDIDCTKNMWRYKYNRNSDCCGLCRNRRHLCGTVSWRGRYKIQSRSR